MVRSRKVEREAGMTLAEKTAGARLAEWWDSCNRKRTVLLPAGTVEFRTPDWRLNEYRCLSAGLEVAVRLADSCEVRINYRDRPHEWWEDDYRLRYRDGSGELSLDELPAEIRQDPAVRVAVEVSAHERAEQLELLRKEEERERNRRWGDLGTRDDERCWRCCRITRVDMRTELCEACAQG